MMTLVFSVIAGLAILFLAALGAITLAAYVAGIVMGKRRP